MADVTFSSAAAAYAKGMAQAAGASAPGGATPGAGAGSGFADLVSDALVDARETGIAAERDSVRAAKGEIGLQDVVTSITNAEVTLQTVVAVRDKVIGAYNEILRMPI